MNEILISDQGVDCGGKSKRAALDHVCPAVISYVGSLALASERRHTFLTTDDKASNRDW